MNREGEASDIRFKAYLLPLIEACGVSSDRVQISYEDDLQDYSVLIDGDDLSDQQMAGLIEATSAGGCLFFASEQNRQRYFDVSTMLERELLKEQVVRLRSQFPGLPRFDANQQQLADFARELEVYCEIEPGSALRVADNHITLEGAETIGLKKLSRLMSAVTVALADDDDIIVGVVGGTA